MTVQMKLDIYNKIALNSSVQKTYITQHSIPTDYDECADDSHMCHVHAVCTNTEGSYQCECELGFIGDGRNCEGELTSSPKGRTLM